MLIFDGCLAFGRSGEIVGMDVVASCIVLLLCGEASGDYCWHEKVRPILFTTEPDVPRLRLEDPAEPEECPIEGLRLPVTSFWAST